MSDTILPGEEGSELYRRFARVKPDDLPWTKWAESAKVSRSFFTNVAEGVDPSIGRVERVLEAIGLTFAEFYADAKPMPTEPHVVPNAAVCTVLLRELVLKMVPAKLPSDARLAILGEALQETLQCLAADPDAATDPALALRTVRALTSQVALPPS